MLSKSTLPGVSFLSCHNINIWYPYTLHMYTRDFVGDPCYYTPYCLILLAKSQSPFVFSHHFVILGSRSLTPPRQYSRGSFKLERWTPRHRATRFSRGWPATQLLPFGIRALSCKARAHSIRFFPSCPKPFSLLSFSFSLIQLSVYNKPRLCQCISTPWNFTPRAKRKKKTQY